MVSPLLLRPTCHFSQSSLSLEYSKPNAVRFSPQQNPPLSLMVEGATEPRWVGEARVKVGGGATAQKVWPLVEDFCGINKYVSSVHTRHQVDGLQGQSGLIRYCAGGEEEEVKWCLEKLMAIYPTQRFLTYEILDNNVGFKSYSATIRVVPVGAGEEPGCVIEWSFVADPFEGFTFDGFLGFIVLLAHNLAENIATALQ